MVLRFRFALLTSALLLTACGNEYGGVESARQPIVQRSDYMLDVQTNGYGLSPSENQRLAGWMQSLDLRYGDRISIDDGASGGTAREEVAAHASRYGLLLYPIAPLTAGAIEPGAIRIIVSRMHAAVPCPTSGSSFAGYSASTSANYGCGVNGNLAAMVADPGDLVRGVPGAPTSDPATSTKAIRALRDAVPTGGGGTVVKTESATSGGSQ